MANRTRQQLLAHLADGESRTNGGIHRAARRILDAASPEIRAASVAERVTYVMAKLFPWPTDAESLLLDPTERARMRTVLEHTTAVVEARLQADDAAARRVPVTLTRTAPPGNLGARR